MTRKEREEMANSICVELKNQGNHSLGTVWLKRMTDEELRSKHKEVCGIK